MTYRELMEDVGDRIVFDAKKSLKQKNKISTGQLYNSLKYKLENNKLVFEMAKHGQWVDQGRKPGSFVPVTELNKWLKQKGIDLKYSYVINKSIRDNGIKPTYFFETAFENNMDDFDFLIDQYVSGLLESLGFDN